MAERIRVATRKGLFTLEHHGPIAWRVAGKSFLGEPVTAVLDDPRSGALYAALRLGHFGCKLHRSVDDGKNWREIAVPTYPTAPDPIKESDKPPSLDQIWTLETGGADQPGRLWAGTIPGGLFRSDDDGQSWSLCKHLWLQPGRKEWFGGGYDSPGVHSVLVDPRNSRHVAVGISCGGVWQSRDDGNSWSLAGKGLRAGYMPPERMDDPNIQDPHRIARCAGAPDVIWCQHHSGIFRSTDGGATFVEIKQAGPSTFGFAVVAHPGDGKTAWFVPAFKDECRVPVDGKLVVTGTRDGGASFAVLDGGLPHGDSYDLVYRHALAIDDTGETLAMGSTTGNLWIGEQGGTRWSRVNVTLPPIAQVAFAQSA